MIVGIASCFVSLFPCGTNIMPLTDTQVRQFKPLTKPFRKSDGGGLFIEIKPNGSKLWKMAYRHGGKQKLLSFGAYPAVSLARARAKRLEAKILLADHIDPMARAKAERREQIALTEHTFAKIAAELIEKQRKEGLSEVTLNKKLWLIGMANEKLGDMPITAITASDALSTLRIVEAKGNYETARRLRSTIGQVFRFAIATARADYDPTFGLRGALISPKVEHRAALTRQETLTPLIKAIWVYGGGLSTVAGLKLMALLYPRPGELRFANWDEFNFHEATWTIPPSRMKMRREHKKPLSKLAIEILDTHRGLRLDDTLVFPSLSVKGQPISENTLNVALRRMGFGADEMTSHGFRASASSILNESGLWNPDAIEAELAHVGGDQVRNAYHRAQYWDERLRMAEWWSGSIEQMKTLQA